MFGIPNTPDNAALAAVVSRRIKSDASLIAGKAFTWRLAGLGIFGCLAGVGVGAACFGYSYITDGRTSFEKMSVAIANALDHVVLKTDGTVRLEPDSTVGIEPGSTVAIEPGSTVGIDSGSKVALDTSGAKITIDSPQNTRPTAQQMQPNATPPSHAKTVTNYTIFKNVTVSNGIVVSGWDFHSSDDTSPYHQFCYFVSSDDMNEVASMKYNIAIDHKIIPTTRKLPFDPQVAYSNCVWFQEEGKPDVTPSDPRKRA